MYKLGNVDSVYDVKRRPMRPLILSRDSPSLPCHACKRNAHSGFEFKLCWHQHTLTHFGILKAKRPRILTKCHALYPQRYPPRHEEKVRATVPFVAFQAETKPYGTMNYTPPSLKVYRFDRQLQNG